MNKRSIARIAVCAGLLAAPSPGTGTGADVGEPSLEQVRKLTERFRDVNVALAEGYVRDPHNMCDTAEMMGRPAHFGAMGIHFMKSDQLGIVKGTARINGTGTHTDFRNPSILIYDPQADGSLELVAVENLVFDAAWNAAGKGPYPSFSGHPYNAMRDDPATAVDEAHGFEPHHDLHVWLYRENPRGIFGQFNPNASCAAHKRADHADAASKSNSHGH